MRPQADGMDPVALIPIKSAGAVIRPRPARMAIAEFAVAERNAHKFVREQQQQRP